MPRAWWIHVPRSIHTSNFGKLSKIWYLRLSLGIWFQSHGKKEKKLTILANLTQIYLKMLHFESLRQTNLSANVLKSFFNVNGGFSGAVPWRSSKSSCTSPQFDASFVTANEFHSLQRFYSGKHAHDSLSNSWSSRLVYSVFLILVVRCRNVEFWFQAPRAFGIQKKDRRPPCMQIKFDKYICKTM